MAAKFPKLRAYLERQIAIKNPQSDYYCGCGVTFDSTSQFKDHAFIDHYGIFQEGSSHYVSTCLQIVVPITDWKRPQPSTQEQIFQGQCLRRSNKSVNCQQQQTQIFDSDQEENVEQRANQVFSFQINLKQLQNSAKTSLFANKSFGSIPNIQKQNNKEILSTLENSCPKINISRKSCLKHKKKQNLSTSQSINDCFESQKNIQATLFKPTDENQNNQLIQYQSAKDWATSQIKTLKLYSQVLEPRFYIRPLYREFFPIRLLGIFELILSKQKQVNEFFICGCGRKISKEKATHHISYAHKLIMLQNSSHIIVKVGSCEASPFTLYLKTQSGQEDTRQIWSCPCQEIAMNKRQFINHVLKFHNGITPLYNIISKKFGK